ncbi:anti-sigma factor [Sphaerisporangium sp. TRM90804]|uniref:anti-sigma factor n=1 Tax=Sphaerisporangium sp. TRM90804 TaxID=3031113 RepID=UPI002446C30D|nr:anti-sigma factor [Sphaerisporangium sp. TRM90804]MDH2426852.1 anti-sigma factor [Sphaerisporangium sp. TRM90804]
MSRDPHTLAGAYALHAVDDPAERASFEEHLDRCAECAEETRGLRETAARLGSAVAQEPPAALRDRVLAEIGVVRQLPPAVSPVADLDRHRASRRPLWPRVVSGLAAAALAAAVTLGVVALRTQDLLDRERQANSRVAAVLAAPDATTVSSADGGVSARVVMSRSQGTMVFFSAGLAPLPDGKTYQLWRIGPAGPLPDRLTRPDPSGRTPPLVLGKLGDTTQVGITVEPAGGSAKPTTSPLMVMPLPPA